MSMNMDRFMMTAIKNLSNEDGNLTIDCVTESVNFNMFRNTKDRITLFAVCTVSCFGLIGNALSIIIILRYLLRSSGTFILFLFVSMADSLVLVIQILELTQSPFSDVYDIGTDWNCKFFKFFWYFSFQLSAGMYMALTVDRYITVRYFYMPQAKHKVLRRSLFTGLGILVFFFLLNSPFFYLSRSLMKEGLLLCNNTQYICSLSLPIISEQMLLLIVNKVHMVVYGIIPYSVTLVFNSILIYQIRTYPQTNHKRTTLVLLMVTFSFIVLTLPNFVHMVAVQDGALQVTSDVSQVQVGVLMILPDICRLLQVISHSINVVFFLRGRQFRQSLWLLLSCARDRRYPSRGSFQFIRRTRCNNYATETSVMPAECMQPLTDAAAAQRYLGHLSADGGVVNNGKRVSFPAKNASG